MAIEVDQIYLSMTSPETGEYLTANVYMVDGVYEADGVTLRKLSIGQLIMALCLQRAAQLENGYFDADNNYVQGIVGCRKGDRYYNGLMDDIEDSSQQLEIMTKIESEVLESSVNMSSTYVTYKGASYSYYAFLTEIAGMEDVPSGTADASSTGFSGRPGVGDGLEELVLAADDDQAPVPDEQARPGLRPHLQRAQVDQHRPHRQREQHVARPRLPKGTP